MRTDRVAKMRRLYDGGATLAEVGRAFGVSKQRVHGLFDKHGIPRRERQPPNTPSPYTPEQVAAMRKRYESGASMTEVGSEFGVGRSTVRRLFVKHGIPRRTGGGPPLPAERFRAMRDYYQDGHSLEETAARFGVSAMSVLRLFRRRGVPLRKSGVRLRRGHDRKQDRRDG